MRILWLLFIFHTAFAQHGFGRSYLKNSRLCHEWTCVNTKLGLPDSLPPIERYGAIIKSLLPEGAWHGAVDTALNACYTNRSRRYTNTCPGQALMHCLVDQLIENCPEESLRKDDKCTMVTSLAGLKYMFSQNMYENFEKNLAVEHRPSWFLRSYFKGKCCNIPPFINTTILSQCGFSNFMQYYTHYPHYEFSATAQKISPNSAILPTNVSQSNNNAMKPRIVSLKDYVQPEVAVDPLDCCNMEEFIKQSWRSECEFELRWDAENRLSVVNKPTTTTAAPSTTPKPVRPRDVVILPQTCEQETCVFKKLNIVANSGSVDLAAFVKFLDNFTNAQPSWTKAKARAITTCFTKPLREYEADCEINKLLACTFDVMTENCPHANKTNLCKHSKGNTVCQISSSKYRPKHRRETCSLPEMVSQEILKECGMKSLGRIEQAPETPVVRHKKNNLLSTYACKDLTPSTSCLMSKMGTLNKYNFMDYFKMKDQIRRLTSHAEWSPRADVYSSAFTNMPLYREHCSSPKKLLNVLDAMIMTCPLSRRKNTLQCAQIFNEMTHAVPIKQQKVTREKLDQILTHFHHVFLPAPLVSRPDPRRRHIKKTVKNPIYDYGLLSSKNVPKVQIIDVKPATKRPLILLPVYMRLPQNQMRPYDGVLRSDPFWLHNKITQAHLNSSRTSPNPTVATKSMFSPVIDSDVDFQKILP